MSEKNKAAAGSKNLNGSTDKKTDNTNTSLSIVPKEVKAETQNPPEFKPVLTLADRLKALGQLNKMNEKLKAMKEHRDNLEGWNASTDGMKEVLSIVDGNATEFKFSNGELIKKVKDLLMVEMNAKISTFENEILLMQI